MPVTLTAHQPAYLPWLGYFDKIRQSDIFVYLDSVQFEKNSFINRNRIKTPQGTLWLTIPVKIKGHISSTIQDMELDNSRHWRRKHLQSIAQNYGKAPRFDVCYPKLERLYNREYTRLSDLCWDHLQFWLDELDIAVPVYRASELPAAGKGSELILNLCRHFEADHYISGILGKNYLSETDFSQQGIAISYQNYQPSPYPQLWGDFIPCLSIIDYWMNDHANSSNPNRPNPGLFQGMGTAL